MTCAGVASIVIARGRLSGVSSSIVGDRIRCCGGSGDHQDPVAKGLDWLGKSFNLEVNPGGAPGTFFYYLYALERVGRLTGRRLIGEHDWYRAGAERVIGLQDDFQGFWSGAGWEDDRNVATSFALLFLSKGKRQVVLGQLQYGDDNGWQLHPDAMRQVVRHVERDWGRDLTWQTIAGANATTIDLLQTPVLLICGRNELRFSASLRGRLKEYIDQGGTIIFDADAGDGCGDAAAFAASVRRLCAEWFTGAELQKLPPNHPVWFAERKIDPTSISDDEWIQGVQACCRTAVFYSPKSLSCKWELSDVLFRRGSAPDGARSRIQTGVTIGENIIAYATGRELKDKLEQRIVLGGSVLESAPRGAIRLAMLQLDAGGNEARRALPNVAAMIAERIDLPLAASAQAAAIDRDTLKQIVVLWIHGRTEFTWTVDQRELLREFLRNGGVIVANAICGSQEFAAAFRREIEIILPAVTLQPIDGSDPVLTPAFDGYDVRAVTIRTPRVGTQGQAFSKVKGPPILEVASHGGIASVFFSPLDLSCALESPNSVQCPGYNTQDAAKIVANLILYALQQ